jgi:hypothetical protein
MIALILKHASRSTNTHHAQQTCITLNKHASHSTNTHHAQQTRITLNKHPVYCKSSFCLYNSTAFYNGLLKERYKGGLEVTERQRRRRRKLLDDLKERRGYSHLKEEALDHTVCRAGFGRGFGPVVRQTTE